MLHILLLIRYLFFKKKLLIVIIGFRMNLMLACALDGNQQILLLAWALVPTENQENWEYFLNHLKKAYPP